VITFCKILTQLLLPSRIFLILSSLVLYLIVVSCKERGSQCEVKDRDLVRHFEKRYKERSIVRRRWCTGRAKFHFEESLCYLLRDGVTIVRTFPELLFSRNY